MDDSASGSDVPAGIDRGADAVAPTSSRQRGRLRRRLRELRRLREAQLLELGALMLEAHKQGRDDTPVIKTKAAEAAATDAEARTLADALETDAGLDTIVTAGIAGPCPTCGTLASTAARFCSNCGTPLDGRPDAAPRTADVVATPLADARELDPAAPATDAAAADPGETFAHGEPGAHADPAEAVAPADPGAPVAHGERVAHADPGEAVAHGGPVAHADPGAPVAPADPAGDAPTTEMPAANGNGASPEELEATRGQDA